MSGEAWIPMRFWFRKTGRAKYISHLDLNRCMMRAIQRAKIPLWYTEGFHPHAFLTFALPLSLGVDGIRESMDLRLVAEMDRQLMIDRINAGLQEDIRVFDITEPVMKPGKIALARYELSLEPEQDPPEALLAALEQLLTQETILVEKKTKSGWKEMDLKPFLDLREIRTEHGAVCFSALLPAGSTQNINPQLLLDALETTGKISFFAKVVRTELYDAAGTPFA